MLWVSASGGVGDGRGLGGALLVGGDKGHVDKVLKRGRIWAHVEMWLKAQSRECLVHILETVDRSGEKAWLEPTCKGLKCQAQGVSPH